MATERGAAPAPAAELVREVGLKCISFNGIPRTINCLNAFRAALPADVQALVRDAYRQGSRFAFISLVPWCAIAFIVSLALKRIPDGDRAAAAAPSEPALRYDEEAAEVKEVKEESSPGSLHENDQEKPVEQRA